ncbi:MAG TPA: protein kinase [Gemmatimonadaceae bacterium]|nr:protein kinase [Gemmatimonadaceae bacterium]
MTSSGEARDRATQARRLFVEAVELPAGERAAFLERACANDAALRADVESLLRSLDGAGGLFAQPAALFAETMLRDASASPDTAPPPARVGPYRIEREIGRGGMGVVYLAERDDPQFHQRVALKVVRAEQAGAASHVSRFLAERQLLVSLEHPHIARLYDGGVTSDGRPYYTMAFCEGGSLAERLASHGALPVGEAVRIGRQLASALAAAHARGVIHRDVKPANVLFDASGAVRLSDFGVARLLDDDVTRSGAVLGTVAYLAPEQVTGRPVDHRADLWALGVTVYEMLAGRRPFHGPSTAAVLYEIAHGTPAPVAGFAPAVPPAIERLVGRLLRKDPDARPQSAAEVERALDAAVTEPAGRGRTRVAVRVAAVIALSAAVAVAGWQLRVNEPLVPPTVLAAEAAAMPSVAVMPFVNTSGDPADEPFVDGLTEELIGTLGKVQGLRVIGRSSVFALEGRGLDARTIADTLGVEHLLEGSVRRSGDRLRVMAQLVSARDGSQRWSETYDREMRDVFAVQQEMAQAMAGALRVRLAPAGDARRTGARPTEDTLAYDLYLKGRYAFNTRSREEDLRRAVGYFEQAVARDSTFALAWSGLSDALTAIGNFGYDRPGAAFGAARRAARRALALDSGLAEARTSLAHVMFVHDYEWEASERELQRAIAEDPGYSFARMIYSVRLQLDRRYAEAVAQLDSARAIDPLRPAIGALLGRVYVNAGMPDQAIAALRGAIDLNPQADLAWQQLGHAYLLKNQPVEAIAALRRAAELSGMRDSAHLAYAYAVTGQRDEAEQIVRALVASSSGRYVVPFHIAMAYAGLGEVDEAFRWLELANEERGSFVSGVAVTAAFAPLHDDPRWRRLLDRVGLD